MNTATVSSQGQVLIPKKVREAVGIRVGTQVNFIPSEYSIAIVPHNKDWLKKGKGILKDEIDNVGGVKKSHQKFELEWNEKG